MSEHIQLRHGLTAVLLTREEAEARAAQHPTLFDYDPQAPTRRRPNMTEIRTPFPVFDSPRDDEDNHDRHIDLERRIDLHVDATDQWVTTPCRIVFNGRGCELELGPYSLCESDAIELHQMIGQYLARVLG